MWSRRAIPLSGRPLNSRAMFSDASLYRAAPALFA